MKTLSVVMPVFNEARTVRDIVARVLAIDIPKELIIVDDCSTDGTRAILAELEAAHEDVIVLLEEQNGGKGAALRRGFGGGHGANCAGPRRGPGVRPLRTPSSFSRFWTVARMSFTDPASSAANRIECCISGIPWPTAC